MLIIDAKKCVVTLEAPCGELKKRMKSWKQPVPGYTRGVLAKYAGQVTSVSLGAVKDMDLKL